MHFERFFDIIQVMANNCHTLERRINMRKLSLSVLLVILCFIAFAGLSGCVAAQHSYGEWTVTKKATCAAEGKRERVCECGEKQVESIPLTEHIEVIDHAVEATCMTEGKTEGKHCSVCGKILAEQQTIPLKEHNFNGFCTVCGKSFGQGNGLEFELNLDKNSYSVTGIGTCWYGSIIIPSTYEGKPVTAIGENAFSGCTMINTIEIPDSITTIDICAFDGCTELTDIVIPDSVTSIGPAAFRGCAKIKSITIPKNVAEIDKQAFYGCSGLTSIEVAKENRAYHSVNNCLIDTVTKTLIVGCQSSIIPVDGSVIRIDADAFSRCAGLKSIIIPACVTEIGDGAFSDCPLLSSIKVEDGNPAYFSVDNCLIEIESKILIVGCKNSIIPADGSVKIIGCEAFSGSIELKDITIPYGVKIIDRRAFYGCTSLRNITIPETVKKISLEVFAGCRMLETITYNGTQTHWDKVEKAATWNQDTGRYTVEFAPSPAFTPSEGIELLLCADKKSYSISGIGTCKDKNIILPSTYNDLPVTEIADKAFFNCRELTSVLIPQSIVSIGKAAFSGCSGITEIDIPDSVTYIGEAAFSGCTGIKKIDIPDSITCINKETFRGCTGLQEIIIPGSVREIGVSAFYGCTSIVTVSVPDGVKVICDNVFDGCYAIEMIIISDSVTNIGKNVFNTRADAVCIEFWGTAEQWKAISKDDFWGNASNKYTLTFYTP